MEWPCIILPEEENRKSNDRAALFFMIEHVMAAPMSVSERVLVMDEGNLIASGTPEGIVVNPQVIEAYLGEEETKRATG